MPNSDYQYTSINATAVPRFHGYNGAAGSSQIAISTRSRPGDPYECEESHQRCSGCGLIMEPSSDDATATMSYTSPICKCQEWRHEKLVPSWRKRVLKLLSYPFQQFQDGGVTSTSFFLLLCLCMATFAPYYVHSVPISLQKELQHQLRLSNAEYAMIDGVYSIAAIITLVPAGLLSEKYDPSVILLVSSFLGFIGSLVVWIGVSMGSTCFLFLGFGICSAFYETQAISQFVILSSFSDQTGIGLGFAIGAEQVFQSVGLVSAQMFGASIGRSFGLGWAFFSLTVACFITFLSCGLFFAVSRRTMGRCPLATVSSQECTGSAAEESTPLVSNNPPEERRSLIVLAEADNDDNLQRLEKTKERLSMSLVGFVAVLSYMSFATINDVPTGLLQKQYGYTSEAGTHVVAFTAVIKFATSVGYAVVADAMNHRLVILAVTFALLSLPFFYLALDWPMPELPFCFLAINQAIVDNIVWALILNNSDGEGCGLQIGLISMFQYTGAAGMEVVQGKLVDYSRNYRLSMVILGAIFLAASFISILLLRIDAYYSRAIELYSEETVPTVSSATEEVSQDPFINSAEKPVICKQSPKQRQLLASPPLCSIPYPDIEISLLAVSA